MNITKTQFRWLLTTSIAIKIHGLFPRVHTTLYTHRSARIFRQKVSHSVRRVVGEFVEHYNTVRLHSALGYVAPKDRLDGRHQEIYALGKRTWSGKLPGVYPEDSPEFARNSL